MTKKELRTKYKKWREQLTENDVAEKSLAIANQLLQLNIWEHDFFHLFLPIEAQNEVDTSYIMSVLMGKDKNIIVSKSNFETLTMQHFLLTDATVFMKNAFGIPEPQQGISISEEQIDVVFVPLLAYDNYGNRVGYGKGFYDLFLKKCKKETVFVGLSFFDAEPLISDIYEEDVRLHYIITPSFVKKF